MGTSCGSRSTRTSSSRSPCRFGPTGGSRCPLVGDLDAADQTPIELRDTITAALKEYVTNPTVTVIVVEATAAIGVRDGRGQPSGRRHASGRTVDRLAGARDGRRLQGLRGHQRTSAFCGGRPPACRPSRSTTRTRFAVLRRSTCGPATPSSCPTEVSMSHLRPAAGDRRSPRPQSPAPIRVSAQSDRSPGARGRMDPGARRSSIRAAGTTTCSSRARATKPSAISSTW